MILIADSGSTKTHWTLLASRKVKKEVETQGLNPYFVSRERIEAVIQEDLAPKLGDLAVGKIFFYGAGCSTENTTGVIRNAMNRMFAGAEVNLYHDILGAARALHGGNEGIACILGTGCNACYYDGNQIYSVVPSLGYLFGDEGAGSHIGKTFMESYLKNKLPSEIRNEFDLTYHLSLEDILNALYNKPSPNRFLASFSEFIAPRQEHPFLHAIVAGSFRLFMEEQVMKYKDYNLLPVGFVGSVAWHYQEILKEVTGHFGIQIGSIMKSPMEGLIRFHSNES
jgi:glucosamine kinase